MRFFATRLRGLATPVRGGALIALVLAGIVGVSGATGKTASKKAVVVTDGNDAAGGVIDITRVSLGAASKSRLRLNIRAAASWEERDLLASSGPPGSICLKLWTKSDPPDETPNYLVCVTSTKDENLRGTVLRERANQLPKRVARATVDKSNRSVTLMFKQRSVGSPSMIRFSAESTRAGCKKVTCVDVAPNAPKTGRLTLSSRAGSGT
jgi:hypothetical protein